MTWDPGNPPPGWKWRWKRGAPRTGSNAPKPGDPDYVPGSGYLQVEPSEQWREWYQPMPSERMGVSGATRSPYDAVQAQRTGASTPSWLSAPASATGWQRTGSPPATGMSPQEQAIMASIPKPRIQAGAPGSMGANAAWNDQSTPRYDPVTGKVTYLVSSTKRVPGVTEGGQKFGTKQLLSERERTVAQGLYGDWYKSGLPMAGADTITGLKGADALRLSGALTSYQERKTAAEAENQRQQQISQAAVSSVEESGKRLGGMGISPQEVESMTQKNVADATNAAYGHLWRMSEVARIMAEQGASKEEVARADAEEAEANFLRVGMEGRDYMVSKGEELLARMKESGKVNVADTIQAMRDRELAAFDEAEKEIIASKDENPLWGAQLVQAKAAKSAKLGELLSYVKVAADDRASAIEQAGSQIIAQLAAAGTGALVSGYQNVLGLGAALRQRGADRAMEAITGGANLISWASQKATEILSTTVPYLRDSTRFKAMEANLAIEQLATGQQRWLADFLRGQETMFIDSGPLVALLAELSESSGGGTSGAMSYSSTNKFAGSVGMPAARPAAGTGAAWEKTRAAGITAANTGAQDRQTAAIRARYNAA